MPIYEYECGKCGHHFDLRRGFGEDGSADCPKCHCEASRVFSAVPVIFKGSGFYVTDHRKPSPVSDSKAESPASKPETKTETKSETKKETKSETKPETKKVAKVSGQ
jgi:putative FmdB family regulatory protein